MGISIDGLNLPRNADGNLDPDGDFQPYWWADGNMSCDCNRSMGHGDYECNTGPNRVVIERITPRGRPDVTLYSEDVG